MRALGRMAAGLATPSVTAAIAAVLFAMASVRSVPLHATIGTALAHAAAPNDALADSILLPLRTVHGPTRVPAERQAVALWTLGLLTFASRHPLPSVAVRGASRSLSPIEQVLWFST